MSSIWDTVSAPYHPLPKWAHWPKPFNVITNINVLACNNDTWLAEIEFYAAFAGELFFHIFVPTPTELVRKTFLGRYRCGLALDIGKWSPMDVIWGKQTTRILAEIFKPFTYPIFYWWAADSALFAMNAWQSLIYAQAQCGLDASDVLGADGFAQVASATTSGSIPFWTVLHEPFPRFDANSGFIQGDPGDQTVYAYAVITNFKEVTITVGWWITNTDRDEDDMLVTQVAPGQMVNVRIIAKPIDRDSTYQLRFNNQLGDWTLLGFVRYAGIRFGVGATTVNPSVDDFDSNGELIGSRRQPCDNQMLKPTTEEGFA